MSAPTPIEPQERPHLAALDVARGLMLLLSVGINAWFTAPAWFGHAVWDEVHPVDLVFPTFVTLTGAGLAMAYARGVRWRRELRRVLVLLLAGFAYTALAQYLGSEQLAWGSFRVLGVLQLYAAIVLFVAVLSRVARRWWVWLIAALVLLAAHTALLALWAADCPGGTLSRTCNPSLTIDTTVFGAAHIYVGGKFGHDPEGLVTAVGAFSSAAIGAAAGTLARAHHRGGSRTALLRGAAIILGSCALGAVVAGQVVEPFKRLWTAPFAASVSAGVVAALLLLHLVLDSRSPGRIERVARYPLVSLGRNSLLVYFGSHAVMDALVTTGPANALPLIGDSWAQIWQQRLAQLADAPGAAWPFCLAAVLAWTLLAMLLHSRKIYLKA